jgi:hypothetical protein
MADLSLQPDQAHLVSGAARASQLSAASRAPAEPHCLDTLAIPMLKTTWTIFHSVKASRLTSYLLFQVLSQSASAGKMLGPEPTTGGDANQSCTVSRHLRKCGALVWASKAALSV